MTSGSGIKVEARFLPKDLQARAQELHPAAAKALAAIRAKTCVGSEWTGWFDFPAERGFTLAKEVNKVVQSLGVFHDLVLVIGIGGSYLGTKAVADALNHTFLGSLAAATPGSKQKPLMVYAGQHLSEQGLLDVLDLLEQKQPIINIISKSGTTTEPGVVFRIIRTYMEKRFGKAEAARRIIATTDPETGALRRLARDLGYKTFAVPPDIGGRYSVLTAVGLVPLALGGFDIEALLGGADSFFKEVRQDKGGPAYDEVLRYASSRQAAYEGGKRIEILAYNEPKLASLVEWWKQLFGESEGKDGKGLFPAGLGYTTDLHSLGQYVQDGCRNIVETFLSTEPPRPAGMAERRLRIPHTSENADELGYLEERYLSEINEAAMQGTKVAHFDGGVPCLTLKAPALDEYGLGALIAFFETACGISGALLGVNPYDQPGVEAYKKNLFALLGRPGFEALGSQLRQRL